MKDFVPFEIAKKLEAKGFDVPCINAINRFKCTYHNGWCEYLDDRDEEFITRKDLKPGDMLLPLIHQVLKWLREEMNISVEPCATPYNCWFYMIKCNGEIKVTCTDNKYKTYEAAALSGIEYVLDNLI